MHKIYREGPVGAMMAELDRAATEIATIVAPISDEAFTRIRDTETTDEDCRSIQSILSHVINSGYGYAGLFRNAWGIEHTPREREPIERAQVATKLEEMVSYMHETLQGRWEMSEEEADAMRIESRWGPVYNFEQLFEHAIVHLLRHRRQIENFLGR